MTKVIRQLIEFYKTFDVRKHEFTNEALQKVKRICSIIHQIEPVDAKLPTRFDELYGRMDLFRYRHKDSSAQIIQFHLKQRWGWADELCKRVAESWDTPHLDLRGIPLEAIPEQIVEMTHIESLHIQGSVFNIPPLIFKMHLKKLIVT